MPYKKRKTFANNKKRVNKKASKAVRSHPKQIQNASYIPKNRLIKFTDFRSYVVTDEGFNGSGAVPPILELGANNPRKFIHSTQGTWDAASLSNKTVSVAGIDSWVTNQLTTPASTAPYLNASALSARVVITAVPVPTVAADGSEADAYQDVIKMCVQTNTRNGAWHNQNITSNFNSEVVSQTPYVRTANLYYNAHGTPRGATISMNYSFKKNNRGRSGTGGPANFFHADTDPSEKDFINIALMPTHSQKYGLTALGGTRLPNIRVEVKISYICLLSEPNCRVTHNMNEGMNLPSFPSIGETRTFVRTGTAV